MTKTALAKKSAALPRQQAGVPKSYAEPRRRVRETLLVVQQKVEEARVRTYWETGWWIKGHILLNRYRAHYGEEVLARLSKDEEISITVLDRCRQFSEKFPKLFPDPIFAARRKLVVSPYPASKNDEKFQLTWTHYRTLLPLEDDKLRRRLAREAARKGWNIPQLETQIKSLSATQKKGSKLLPAPQNSPTRSALLTPKKGELLIYQIVRDQDALALDHGFAKYWNLSREETKLFSEGDIVRKLPDGKMEKLANGTKSLLYTYEADVIRVVDGDTIWMKIYLEGRANPPWVKEKLRLRDLDAPELNTPEGRAAKKFVEDWLAKAEHILITTTKPDKWARYLSDIFIEMASGNEIYLNNALLEAGHAQIKTHWSLSDWQM